MKKIGLLMLALVIALGALGIGYAKWSDTVVVNGSINTGTVCFSFEPGTFDEVGGCPDKNWTTWEELTSSHIVSCPPGYSFFGIHNVDKCVADVSITPNYDANHINIESLTVTINNAYPFFLTDISFYLCNCGTIPIKINAPTIVQNPSLLIQYGDNIGVQIHPRECVEVSMKIGVTEHVGHYVNDVWETNDPSMPLTGQGVPLSFTVSVSAVQYNEYGY
jgi:predicted ribosomally synthesized peptide with SipW-like signal peptide